MDYLNIKSIKKSSLFSIFFIGLLFLFYAGCSDSDSKFKENISYEHNISGVVQKGPFAKGAVVKAYELVDGVRSGSMVQTTTYNNKGNFSFNSFPWTNPTQIVVIGSYFDEVTGNYRSDGNLSVVIKGITGKIEGGVNVNILTQITSARIIKLLKEGKTFDKAYSLANNLIKDIFNLDLLDGKGPESLDLTKTDKPDNAKLLQISAGFLSLQNPQKVLEDIVDDAKDGNLDGEGGVGVQEIKDKVKTINLSEIASNIDSEVGSDMATHIEQMLQGTIPVAFELKFIDRFDVEPSTKVNSNIVTLLGFDGNLTVKVINADAMINGDYTLHSGDTRTLPAGTTIQLLTLASSNYGTKKTATLKVNGKSFYFSTTTKSNPAFGDYTPISFNFSTLSTTLQPVVKGLQELNISTPKEFAHQYQKVKPIDLFLQLKEKDSSISSEMFISMMKKLETKVVIEPLVKDGNLSQKELNSMVVLNRPISSLKQRELRTFSIDTNDSALLDKFYKQQLLAFNQELEARGKEKLNLVEFKNLVTILDKVHPLFNFYPTTLQNIEVNSTQITRKFSKPKIGEKTVILNPVNEYNGSISVIPSEYLKFKPHEYIDCKNVAVTYPQQVMGTFFAGVYVGQRPLLQEVNSSSLLMGDENQQRYFQINQKGVAHIRVHNKSTTTTPFILKHYDTNIVNQNIPANSTVYLSLPIFANDLCVPYYMNRDNTNLDVTIMDVEKPTKMVEEFDDSNGRYNLVGNFALSDDEINHKEGHVFQFEIFRNNQENPQRTLYIKTEDTSAVDYLLVSPDGEIIVQYSPLIGGDTSIDFTVKDGKWLLYALPTGSVRAGVDSEKLHLNKLATVGQNSSQSNNGNSYKISLYNTRAVNLKKFIIGELKEVAFSQDGEDAANNAGDLSINLHTNVAPKLNMTADVQKYYDGSEVKALNCWIYQERDISAFDDSYRCQEFKENLNSILKKYIIENMLYNASSSSLGRDIIVKQILSQLSDENKNRIMEDFETNFKNKITDATFRDLADIDNSDMYNNWKENIVQINSMQFPLNKEYHYKILDEFSPYFGSEHKNYVPKVPVNIPIFGVTKERLALSTSPISFNYEAVDDDEVDKSAQAWAVLKYVANQALAAVPPQNYAAFLCNTVNTMKELRQIEIDGEDDPLGDASVHLNRFSSQDNFYGLMYGGLSFGISGFADIPNHYTSYDKGLDYASIACSITNVAQGNFVEGYSLASNIGALMGGDTITAQQSLDAIRAEMLSKVEVGSEEYNNIVTAFNELKQGNASVEVFNLLKKSLESSYINGDDIFKTLDDVQADAGGLGGAGHNVMRTDGVFFFSPFNKAKTYAKMQFKEVNALPVSQLSVTLDGVTIYSDMETGDDSAEVELIGRVGVIGDKTPVENPVLYDNGSQGYTTYTNTPFSDRQSFYREYKGIHDGDTLPVEGLQLYTQNFNVSNNVAAIYIEIGLYEDDGNTIDNDMIGVHTNTFTLENLYNSAYYERRENLGNNKVRLYFSRPVYNERNLESVVEFVNTEHASEQIKHNRERISNPSALINYHIDITLGQFEDYPVVDVDRNTTTDGSISQDRIDIDKINLHDVSHILGNSRLHIKDVYKNNRVLTYDNKGTLHIVKITPQHRLQKVKDINVSSIDVQNADLFKMPTLRNFDRHDYLDSYFVDDSHLVILRPEGSGGKFNSTLNLVSIGEEEQNVSLVLSLPLSGKPRFMRKVRENEQSIDIIVSFTDAVDRAKSKLSVYRVESNKITKLSDRDALYGIEDILRVDNNSVVMKAKEYHKKEEGDDCYKHMEYCGYAGYISDAWYLETYHINQNGELSLTDRKKTSISQYTLFQYTPIFTGNVPSMKNVNYNKSNRKFLLVSSLFGLNYQQSTDSYTIGERIGRYIPKMQENPRYAYELKGTHLDAIIDSNGTKRVVQTPLDKLFDDDTIYYYSVSDFQFIDDTFVLATQQVGHQDNSNSTHYIEERLSLIDTQYNGSIGISGDDFNKTIILNHSNSYKHTLHFTLDANSSVLADVNVSFKIEDADTNQTIFSGKDTIVNNLNDQTTYWYKAKLSCVANQCSIDLDYKKLCTNKKHNYTVVVSYRGYESIAHFSAYLKETTPYLGDDKNINIIRINPTSYDSLNTFFISYPNVDKDPNSCVNRFEVTGKPSWMSSGTAFSFTANKKVLELRGTPTLNDIGNYDITVKAFNDAEYDSAVLHVHVLPPDTIPDSVNDITQTDLNISSNAVATVQIKGINAPARLKIAGGEYSIDGGHSWLNTPSNVTNETVIQVRQLTSSQYSTTKETTLYINNAHFFTFKTVTKADPATNDTTPDAFSFTDISDVELNSEQRATITISGITKESPLSIVGGEYSLDGGKTWLNTNTTIQNGTVVTVRHQSANQYFQAVNTTLTVGGVSDTFTTTTKAQEAPKLSLNANTNVNVGDTVSFTPQNSGGSVTTWRINSVPTGLIFDPTHGILSGTVESKGEYDINITASNSGGEDSLTFRLFVSGKNGPYIDGGFHTLDETVMSFTFADDSNWRSAITGIDINVDYQSSVSLTEHTDYNLTAGVLKLFVTGTNSVPTTSGQWQITLHATDYEDVTIYVYVDSASLDANATASTLRLEHIPFSRASKSTITFDAVDRFGNRLAYSNAKLYFNAIDNSSAHIEPYKADVGDGMYKLLRPTPLHPNINATSDISSDENGTFQIKIFVPAYVDVNDGFELELKTDSGELIKHFDYHNSATSHILGEWSSRFNLKHLGVTSEGKQRYSLSNIRLLEDNETIYMVANMYDTTRVGGFGYAYGPKYIELMAFDSNGVQKWESNISISEDNKSMELGAVALKEGRLYVGLSTNGTISGEVNSDAWDSAFVVVDATNGSKITAKSWGDGTNKRVVGIEPYSHKVALYVSNRDQDTPETWKITFVQINEEQERYSIESTTSNTDNNMAQMEVYEDNTTIGYAYATHRVVANAQDMSTSWQLNNDNRVAGSSDYNYATITNIWNEQNSSYIVGSAKKGFFDYTMPVDSVEYATLTRRAKNGAYLWSHVFDESVRGSAIATRGGVVDNVVYVAYKSKESCPTYSGDFDCDGLRVVSLNNYTGELLHSQLWKTDIATQVVNRHTIHYSRSLYPSDTVVAKEEGQAKAVYIAGKADGKFGTTPNSYGVPEYFIVKMIKDDSASDNRTGYHRVNSIGIVNDYDHKLQWLDNNSISEYSWDNRLINTVVVDGIGWRVPTLNELLNIVDSNNNAPALKNVFQFRNFDSIYWSNDEVDANNSPAVNFENGGSDSYPKDTIGYIRYVRELP